MMCWRRLRAWQQAGVWDLIHFALLDWLARELGADAHTSHRVSLVARDSMNSRTMVIWLCCEMNS
jgi:hypothetical protein